MLIYWTAVIDDGTRPYGPGISVDQRRPLYLPIGDATTIEVALINPVGGVVTLDAGEFLQLNARTLARPQRPILTKRSAVGASGRHAFTLASDDTAHLPPQRGEFDVWAVRGGDRTVLIPISEFGLTGSALGVNHL